MYIRVAISRVSYVAARVGLATAKVFPRATDVCLARTWVGRLMEHIASVASRFVAMVARISPAVVALDLAARSFSLIVAWIALAAKNVSLAVTKISLIVVEVFLTVARVLE